jgi:preprotein translocase subunit YajC
LQQIIFLVPLMLAFYLLLVRPQQRRARQQQALLSDITAGDEVVTIGGMYGRVVDLDESSFSLEIAPGTTVKFAKRAVASKITPDPAE